MLAFSFVSIAYNLLKNWDILPKLDLNICLQLNIDPHFSSKLPQILLHLPISWQHLTSYKKEFHQIGSRNRIDVFKYLDTSTVDDKKSS